MSNGLRRQIARVPGARAVHYALFPRSLKPSAYPRPIRDQREGNSLIERLLRGDRPVLVARAGGVELSCIVHYLKHRRRRIQSGYPSRTRQSMANNAGFFPPSDEALDQFCGEYLAAVGLSDALGVWFKIGEDFLAEKICPSAELIAPRSIEPYYHPHPWSRVLRDRRVLVVHPFAESITEQYELHRADLFENPDVLPPVQLRVLKAVQSIAGEPTAFSSWFLALESMKRAMDAIDYDVCIVGAGAYGLPLAAHAKRSGKQAVHLGGATQILFGIKGRRWDEREIISGLYNDYWVRPKASEVPRNFTAVEGGCYW